MNGNRRCHFDAKTNAGHHGSGKDSPPPPNKADFGELWRGFVNGRLAVKAVLTGGYERSKPTELTPRIHHFHHRPNHAVNWLRLHECWMGNRLQQLTVGRFSPSC